MNPALLALLEYAAAGLPDLIKTLRASTTPAAPVSLPLPSAPLNPLGWPSPLPPEVGDATIADAPAPTGKSGNPGIRLLQVALVAAGQKVDVDGLSRPGGETETALAAVIQHIMSRVG